MHNRDIFQIIASASKLTDNLKLNITANFKIDGDNILAEVPLVETALINRRQIRTVTLESHSLQILVQSVSETIQTCQINSVAC